MASYAAVSLVWAGRPLVAATRRFPRRRGSSGSGLHPSPDAFGCGWAQLHCQPHHSAYMGAIVDAATRSDSDGFKVAAWGLSFLVIQVVWYLQWFFFVSAWVTRCLSIDLALNQGSVVTCGVEGLVTFWRKPCMVLTADNGRVLSRSLPC